MLAAQSLSTTGKKRPLEEYTPAVPSPSSPSASTTTILVKKACPNDDDEEDFGYDPVEVSNRFISQQHLDTIREELELERSLRRLDADQAKLLQERLATELEAAKRDSDKTSKLLKKYREDSERILSDLKASRTNAVSELQQVRVQLSQLQQAESRAAMENKALKKACQRLQEQVDAQVDSEARIRSEMDEMRETFEAQLESLRLQASSSSSAAGSNEGLMSAVEPAPSALMKELQKIRIKLAEAERQNRQLHLRHNKLEERNTALVRDREEASIAKGRVAVLEKKVSDLRHQHEEARAQNEAWTGFGMALMRELGMDASGIPGGPPEVTTVLRHMESAQAQAQTLKRETQRKDQKIEYLSTSLEETTQKLRQATEQIAGLETGISTLQRHVDDHRMRVHTLGAEKAILEREASSLRALVKTFDGMPLLSPTRTNQSDILASPKLETSVKTLEVRLQSLRDELDLVRQERDRLAQDVEASNAAKDAKDKELADVKDKFARLREALHAERAKVGRAEERALQAESLAGKGAFNPETMRALHFTQTPLVESLKEEISVLRRQIDAKGDGSLSSTAAKVATEDSEKKMQRLIESFREQISLFREGVWLMFGYRVELLPGTDRPTFRVRSVFAENESDELILKWPKGGEASSLDILETGLAKLLATTPSYEYVTKFHNLPAFLASVQLSLFEKQTVMF